MKFRVCFGLIMILAPVAANAQEVLAVFSSRGECRRAEASWFNDQWAQDKTTASNGTDRGRSEDMNPFVCSFVNGHWSLVLR
jgi:hypothetical protein